MEYLLEILADGPKTTPELKNIVYTEKKIGERNTREALKELVSAKLIDKRKNGRMDEFFLLDEDDQKSKNTSVADSFDGF